MKDEKATKKEEFPLTTMYPLGTYFSKNNRVYYTVKDSKTKNDNIGYKENGKFVKLDSHLRGYGDARYIGNDKLFVHGEMLGHRNKERIFNIIPGYIDLKANKYIDIPKWNLTDMVNASNYNPRTKQLVVAAYSEPEEYKLRLLMYDGKLSQSEYHYHSSIYLLNDLDFTKLLTLKGSLTDVYKDDDWIYYRLDDTRKDNTFQYQRYNIKTKKTETLLDNTNRLYSIWQTIYVDDNKIYFVGLNMLKNYMATVIGMYDVDKNDIKTLYETSTNSQLINAQAYLE